MPPPERPKKRKILTEMPWTRRGARKHMHANQGVIDHERQQFRNESSEDERTLEEGSGLIQHLQNDSRSESARHNLLAFRASCEAKKGEYSRLEAAVSNNQALFDRFGTRKIKPNKYGILPPELLDLLKLKLLQRRLIYIKLITEIDTLLADEGHYQ